jgi:hypothetical protein
MPPRRSARVAAVVERESSALPPLPLSLALAIFALLPVDQRLRCREVCRGWRAVLTEISLWRRLDLSASGISPGREPTSALLRAAAARAAGQLETLDISGCGSVSDADTLAVVTANSASLRELHLRTSRGYYAAKHVEALLRAAPGVRACAASVFTPDLELARALLRAEPPFAALRLESLCVGDIDGEESIEADEVLALTADLAACSFLGALELCSAALDEPAALDALVDAALACRVRALRLEYCDLPDAAAPALARLLGGGALAELDIAGHPWDNDSFLEAPVAVLAHALRACSTLTTLKLQNVSFWDDPGAATALLGALTGHASLRTLNLSNNRTNAANPAAAGAALGALVAANAAALTDLDVSWCDLGDAGLRPLFDALPANTHLRTLDCAFNGATDAFACDVLLPAVRANGSLQQLKCRPLHLQGVSAAAEDALAEAKALVAQRAAGR